MPKVMLLPVTITDKEKLLIQSETSVMITEVEALEKRKREIPAEIKGLMASIYLRNHALAAGVIEREVEIREEHDIFAGKVRVFRTDTNEFVKERSMDPDERQVRLGESAVPGPTPDNVRSLAEHREKSEEQLAAGTPEEAEALRQARLADEAATRAAETVEQLMAAATVEMRGEDGFIASVPTAPGLASGHSGPIRATPEEAVAELRSELARLLAGTAPPPPDEAARAAEIAALAEQQAADAAKDKPKKGLQVPKGAKGRRTKPPKAEGDNPNGVDTTPPPGAAF